MPVGHSRPAHPNGFYVNENGSVATDPYNEVPYKPRRGVHCTPVQSNGFYVNENGSVATDPYDVVPYYLVGEGFPLPHTQTDFI